MSDILAQFGVGNVAATFNENFKRQLPNHLDSPLNRGLGVVIGSAMEKTLESVLLQISNHQFK